MRILIFFLLLQSNLIWSQSIVAPMTMDYKEIILVNKAAKSFINDSSITIILKHDSPLHPYVEGVTYQINPKLYTIDINFNVKDNKMRKWTLLHELGHVIDMSLGRLSQTPPRWMGKKMNRDLPWDIRPWEISADEWVIKMWEALVDEPIPYIILKIEN